MWRAIQVRLSSWLSRRRNPLLRDPEYAQHDAEERACRDKHRNASGPRRRKRERLNQMLAGRA